MSKMYIRACWQHTLPAVGSEPHTTMHMAMHLSASELAQQRSLAVVLTSPRYRF